MTNALMLESFDLTIGSGVLHDRPDDIDADEDAAAQAAAEEAAARLRIEERLEALTRNLSSLAAQSADHRRMAIQSVARSVEPALKTLLPSLADRGFAAELANAVTVIVTEKGLEATLLVSTEDLDRIAAALGVTGRSNEITISATASTEPGTASLIWPDGGACFEKDKLVHAAMQLVDEHLQQTKGSPARDD